MDLVPVSSASRTGDSFVIDARQVQNIGLRVHTVRRQSLARTIRSFGYVREVQSIPQTVALSFPLEVTKVHVAAVGLAVTAGTPLVDVSADALASAQEDLLAAKRAGNQAEVRRRRAELRGLGIDDATLDQVLASGTSRETLTIHSPWPGTVVYRDVAPGATVEPNQTLFRVAGPRHLSVEAQVRELDCTYITSGSEAVLTFDALPGVTVQGMVSSVANRVDEPSKTVALRIALRDGHPPLLTGMTAQARIAVRLGEVLCVPQSAAVESNTGRLAYVAFDGGRFEPRELTLGRTGDDGMAEALAGIAEGDRVVVSGQLLIDFETRLRGIGVLENGDCRHCADHAATSESK
jgi:RND family efflux transporter MFP subunit